MLHKFYVGSRETGIACMQIYGDSKKEAIQRLIKMTGGEIPFVYFNSVNGVDVVSDVLHEESSVTALEPTPHAYICQQAMRQERNSLKEIL